MDEKGGFPNMPFLVTLGFAVGLGASVIVLLMVVAFVLFGGGA